ncbi:MAG: hypothetical protein GX640_13835 [Fibrobacter sp.]|nr:hypothetical protein [Fibrobacter sp.]
MQIESKKFTVYLPSELLSTIKLEAAHKGNMHYSELISLKLMEAFDAIKGVKNLSELTDSSRYKNVLDSFTPSRVGRPKSKKPSSKVRVTLYLSEITINSIETYAKRFSTSNSSVLELALLISHRELNSSIPLFDGTKLYESDFELLQNVLKKAGAESITEFLYACQYPWIIEPIKKEIEATRRADR